MAVIIVIENEQVLSISSAGLRAVCEAAAQKTDDRDFLHRLSEASEYGCIDIWKCNEAQREIFALSVDEIREGAINRSGVEKSLLERLEMIALEVRHSVLSKEYQ